MPKLFVGGIKWEATKEQLEDHFSQFGDVVSCKMVTDKETGKPRGFSFIEFATDAEANRAIEGGNGQQFMGRPLTVNMAREREHTARGGFSESQNRANSASLNRLRELLNVRHRR